MHNPFKILNVARTVEKKEILQQVMVALHQNGPYDARTVAEAQKNLFSPLSRATAEFMHCLDMESVMDREPPVPGDATAPELTLLEIFHAEDST